MLELGSDVNFISQVTGFSPDYILSLKEKTAEEQGAKD